MENFIFVQCEKIPQQLLKILLKIVSLRVKLKIIWIQISRKGKFHKHPVVVLLKCYLFISLSVANIIENTFEVVVLSKVKAGDLLYRSFQRKIPVDIENLPNGYFYHSYFKLNFRTYFSVFFFFLLLIEKSIKFINEN